MKRYLSLMVMAALWSNPSGSGEVYKWIDDEGKVNYSDIPRGQASEKVIVSETNIAEPVKIAEPTEDNNQDNKSLKITPIPEFTERQQRLEAERAAEEKCQRYYGVSCGAVSRMLQRRNLPVQKLRPRFRNTAQGYRAVIRKAGISNKPLFATVVNAAGNPLPGESGSAK